MAVYLISYDVVGPNRDYEAVKDHIIRTHGTRAKPLESVWVVKTTKSAAEVRNALAAHVDSNDKLLIVTPRKGWATRKISKVATDWMHQHV
ncbi:hypothetical protein ACFY9N_04015 [Microbacterium sp. NPDC008134]|uniref:hypothetical protein n=1 Tax=Microbacterium sp. NPDC008134 TaxID=3364183 RepID=UPI0036F180BD